MENFTPVSALIGGLMIGLASTFLLWTTGRIAGISGILGGLLSFERTNLRWRAAFVVGLIFGPVLVSEFGPGITPITIDADIPLLIAAGLLVGIGTRLGSGCTSGHGVCGIGRLSVRSLVATVVFMATAAITVFVARHVLAGGV
ncbi:MAG: YeeE/YedE family protein [Rhodospirillales bacterium]|nr:YeeE/YedE family protein [Rhodospirillales bacterium]